MSCSAQASCGDWRLGSVRKQGAAVALSPVCGSSSASHWTQKGRKERHIWDSPPQKYCDTTIYPQFAFLQTSSCGLLVYAVAVTRSCLDTTGALPSHLLYSRRAQCPDSCEMTQQAVITFEKDHDFELLYNQDKYLLTYCFGMLAVMSQQFS